MIPIVQSLAGKNLIDCDKENCGTLRWVLTASSKDETRWVLVNTLYINEHEGKWWAISTDGRRLHAARIEQGVSPLVAGTYEVVHNSAKRLIAIRRPDDVYPNAWEVVPKVDDLKPLVVDIGSKVTGSKMFELCARIHAMNKAAFDFNYIFDAVKGMEGCRACVWNKPGIEPTMIQTDDGDSVRFAVIMPLRTEW